VLKGFIDSKFVNSYSINSAGSIDVGGLMLNSIVQKLARQNPTHHGTNTDFRPDGTIHNIHFVALV
jgi:hypothetical protein